MVEHLTTGWAAWIVGCSRNAVTRWCHARVLPYHRIGAAGHRRVKRDDLRHFILNFSGFAHRDREAMLQRLGNLPPAPKTKGENEFRDERIKRLTSYSTGDVGYLLRCNGSTVALMCNSGRLRSYRIGRNRRITREALLEYIATYGGPNMELGNGLRGGAAVTPIQSEPMASGFGPSHTGLEPAGGSSIPPVPQF